jgi:hypothetical protein
VDNKDWYFTKGSVMATDVVMRLIFDDMTGSRPPHTRIGSHEEHHHAQRPLRNAMDDVSSA